MADERRYDGISPEPPRAMTPEVPGEGDAPDGDDGGEGREARRDTSPEPAPELGAAFQSSEAAARAWGAPVDADTAARRRAAAATPQAPDGGPGVFPPAYPPFAAPVTRPEPMGPRQEWPPQPGEPRTLSLPSTGDPGIDAMLMCRQVFESLPDYERRRLLTYLADRYA